MCVLMLSATVRYTNFDFAILYRAHSMYEPSGGAGGSFGSRAASNFSSFEAEGNMSDAMSEASFARILSSRLLNSFKIRA